MKFSTRMVATTLFLTIGLASYGIAQMMGDHQGNSSMGMADSTQMSGMMGTGMMAKMGDMSQGCKMMSNDFEKLQEHFDAMMQMDDMKAMKAEMKQHQSMMQEMRDNMSEHQAMCMKMMNADSKMGKMGNKMNGCSMMMSQDDKDSENTEPHSHNH